MSLKTENIACSWGILIGALIASMVWFCCTFTSENRMEKRRAACQQEILRNRPGEEWIKGEPVLVNDFQLLLCPVVIIRSPSARHYDVIQVTYRE